MKSVYIHIPFCNNICSYCDFPKIYYHKKWINDYLESLSKEIDLRYKGDLIDTIYIGGGTPSSLELDELEKLFEIIKKIKSNYLEFTIECNLDSLTKEKIDLFKKNNINRISIGIESFNESNLEFLNRKLINLELIEYIKKIGINNINVDLIYALPNESKETLIKDIDLILELDIPHISTYSLIIEPNTVLYNNNTKNIDDNLDLEMYNIICSKLNNYNHYEISNFAKEGYESKHNLTYWNNENYYGFGLGASGYIKNIRYDNTKSFNNYVSGKYLLNEDVLSKNDILSNEFILGFRKINGINKQDFYNKYKFDILNLETISKLIKEEKLIENQTNIFINSDYIYTSNDILINFLQIDWKYKKIKL